eukprot:13226213-Alexandrium_andersonii.AAC.1
MPNLALACHALLAVPRGGATRAQHWNPHSMSRCTLGASWDGGGVLRARSLELGRHHPGAPAASLWPTRP